MANYHVVRNKEGDWTVRKAGADRASGVFNYKKEAEKAAKGYASNTGGGEVRLHGRDGRIRDSDTVAPAKDPFPPRDKRH